MTYFCPHAGRMDMGWRIGVVSARAMIVLDELVA